MMQYVLLRHCDMFSVLMHGFSSVCADIGVQDFCDISVRVLLALNALLLYIEGK